MQKFDLTPLRGIKTMKRTAPSHSYFHWTDALVIREFVESQGRPRGIVKQLAAEFKVPYQTMLALVDGRTHKR